MEEAGVIRTLTLKGSVELDETSAEKALTSWYVSETTVKLVLEMRKKCNPLLPLGFTSAARLKMHGRRVGWVEASG